MTLLVLSDLSVGVMGLRANDDRHCLESCLPGGTQAFGSKEDSVATACRARHDRLKDAAQRDVSRQLGDLFVRELGPRVVRILLKGIDRDKKRQAFGSESVEREFGNFRARRRIDDNIGTVGPEALARLRTRLVNEIELLFLRLVPRQAHERIVPLRSAP